MTRRPCFARAIISGKNCSCRGTSPFPTGHVSRQASRPARKDEVEMSLSVENVYSRIRETSKRICSILALQKRAGEQAGTTRS